MYMHRQKFYICDMYLTGMGTGHNAEDPRVFIHMVHCHTAKHPVVSVNKQIKMIDVFIEKNTVTYETKNLH